MPMFTAAQQCGNLASLNKNGDDLESDCQRRLRMTHEGFDLTVNGIRLEEPMFAKFLKNEADLATINTWRRSYFSFRQGSPKGSSGEFTILGNLMEIPVKHTKALVVPTQRAFTAANHPISAFSVSPPSHKIFTFWNDGNNLPILVSKCIASWVFQNPHHKVILLTDANCGDWVTDWPKGGVGAFESVQKKSNWVRMSVLRDYGGLWIDASSFATAPLESWIDLDPSKCTVWTTRGNENVFSNWAIFSPQVRHPVILGWIEYMRHAHTVGPEVFIAGAFDERPGLRDRWGEVSLPYLWCHLCLQCLMHDHPELEGKLTALPSKDGPLYRSALFETCGSGENKPDEIENGRKTAEDMASRPIRYEDRFFVKLVGPEREFVQMRHAAGTYVRGSLLDVIMKTPDFQHGIDFVLRSSVSSSDDARKDTGTRLTKAFSKPKVTLRSSGVISKCFCRESHDETCR